MTQSKNVFTHQIVASRNDVRVVVCEFFAPTEAAAVIMGRAYVKSLVAHTKGDNNPITKGMCKLHKYPGK